MKKIFVVLFVFIFALILPIGALADACTDGGVCDPPPLPCTDGGPCDEPLDPPENPPSCTDGGMCPDTEVKSFSGLSGINKKDPGIEYLIQPKSMLDL